MARTFHSFYNVFYQYFSEYDMNHELTMRAYNLQPGGKYNAGTWSRRWSSLKKEYSDEYLEAKQDYLDNLGVTEESIISKVFNIADNACRDSDKLKALEMLMRYRSLGVDDKVTVEGMRDLKVEIVRPSTPADLLEGGGVNETENQ